MVSTRHIQVVFKGLVQSGLFPFLGKTETEPVLEIPKFSHDWTELSQTSLYQSFLSRDWSQIGLWKTSLFVYDFLRYVLLILSCCVVLSYWFELMTSDTTPWCHTQCYHTPSHHITSIDDEQECRNWIHKTDSQLRLQRSRCLMVGKSHYHKNWLCRCFHTTHAQLHTSQGTHIPFTHFYPPPSLMSAPPWHSCTPWRWQQWVPSTKSLSHLHHTWSHPPSSLTSATTTAHTQQYRWHQQWTSTTQQQDEVMRGGEDGVRTTTVGPAPTHVQCSSHPERTSSKHSRMHNNINVTTSISTTTMHTCTTMTATITTSLPPPPHTHARRQWWPLSPPPPLHHARTHARQRPQPPLPPPLLAPPPSHHHLLSCMHAQRQPQPSRPPPPPPTTAHMHTVPPTIACTHDDNDNDDNDDDLQQYAEACRCHCRCHTPAA